MCGVVRSPPDGFHLEILLTIAQYRAVQEEGGRDEEWLSTISSENTLIEEYYSRESTL
jgi:hypothetical protein